MGKQSKLTFECIISDLQQFFCSRERMDERPSRFRQHETVVHMFGDSHKNLARARW